MAYITPYRRTHIVAKIMLFIDGTWLYSNSPRLSETFGDRNYHLDFGKLPGVLAQEVAQQLGTSDVDVVRTYLFGSYADNCDLRDEDAAGKSIEFYDMLKQEFHYEVELFAINFKGRRLRKADRDLGDDFEPKEKCVDIALATTMLYLAAIPYAYDIAIAVIGDRDFTPMLQNVRRLGKRVAIASIKGSCAPDFSDPRDEARVKDFDIIWIDDLLHKLELKFERHQLACESPTHRGNRLVWTTFHPRKGQHFYCDECRTEFERQKTMAQQTILDQALEPLTAVDQSCSEPDPTHILGRIKRLISDKGYGFIESEGGPLYFFHLTDLDGLIFGELIEGLPVRFEVKKPPSDERAGAAKNVRASSD